jgi:TfoX/Sxy family transcriptional regulator of competence genes
MIGSMSPEDRYAAIVEVLAARPDVTGRADEPSSKHRFGSSELKVRGRIFAMLVRGRLVVKLPRQRVDALVAGGGGERFDPRRDGRLMKEWLTVDPASDEPWLPLATEAMEFVASKR